MTRESMEFDVVIVGAGPAGLSAAIRLAQLNQQHEQSFSICVIEKGAEVGAHILSGCVLEPRALNALLPNWRELDSPIKTAVTEDRFYFLTEKKAFRLPTPKPMQNHGNYLVSLSQVCRWLAQQAEALGVNIFPGFAATQLLTEEGCIVGVGTGDMGVSKEGEKTENYQPGIDLRAKQVLFAEGCRGLLTEQVIKQFNLREKADPQTYGLGIKEVWRVDAGQHQPGNVVHTVGWPLDSKTYGGSFLYHMDNQRVAVGFVTGLDYKNPYLSPFEEMQRLKLHPHFRPIFEGGERIAYGARALNEGGFQSIPKLSFPGGLIVGCGAGFLNVAKIKGTHTAMQSGMFAAEATFSTLQDKQADFDQVMKNSWVTKELKQVKNIRPAFKWGLGFGLCYAALDSYLFRGYAPWTWHHHADHQSLKTAEKSQRIHYPKPDGKITFDRLSSVFLSGTHHQENQPVHLQLHDAALALSVNYLTYASPETRYCPAGVYEILEENGVPRLQINAANCLHCKTCDIKDPKQNIYWASPEGGGGPNYTEL
ncbi:MAG: electron transfer flavoprotein [marine bacterium B5-7]|nr:MAG: electron transfer flavoprotein [marine bacterium B5-7]